MVAITETWGSERAAQKENVGQAVTRSGAYWCTPRDLNPEPTD
ncbi:MAG: hypothetical protein JWP19_2767 [Rhodoglobus sp.]|nr:hypothetical protein [Rhodoglobus sp.]